MNARQLVSLASALSLAAILAGCPASQTFTTARTIPEGAMQHTPVVEFMGIETGATCGTAALPEDCIGFVAVPFPGYILRYGVNEMLDLGFKFSMAGTMAVDFKIQLVESDAFDFAIDPGLSSAIAVNYLNLPLLISLNLGDMATITLIPKVSYGFLIGDNTTGDFVDGLFMGGGVNVQLRVSPTLAITPGVEFQSWLPTGSSSLGRSFGDWYLVTFGVGFSIGPQSYGPGARGAPAEPMAPVGTMAPAPAPAPVQNTPVGY